MAKQWQEIRRRPILKCTLSAPDPNGRRTPQLIRNDAVAARCSCDAPSQKAGATPASRETTGTPFGGSAGAGDEASPAPSATGTSQLRAPRLRLSTASVRVRVNHGAPRAADTPMATNSSLKFIWVVAEEEHLFFTSA